jgi:hypothetical protein
MRAAGPNFYYVPMQVSGTCLVGRRACIVRAKTIPREGESVTTQDEATEFVGYGPAAEYLGLKRNTLSSYVARGIGPEANADRRAEGQYNLPVFTRDSLEAWKAARPGQGARTDLASVAA